MARIFICRFSLYLCTAEIAVQQKLIFQSQNHIIMQQTKKRNNNQNYDERTMGEFFWVGDSLAHLTKQTTY